MLKAQFTMLESELPGPAGSEWIHVLPKHKRNKQDVYTRAGGDGNQPGQVGAPLYTAGVVRTHEITSLNTATGLDGRRSCTRICQRQDEPDPGFSDMPRCVAVGVDWMRMLPID